MNICIVSDGKKGHLSQTYGLAEALIKRAQLRHPDREHSIRELNICKVSWLGKFRYKGEEDMPQPVNLILCAGHSTHFAALSLARRLKCACMVCMRPSLPLSFFTMGLIPEHDQKKKERSSSKVLYTKGAMNNIHPSLDTEKKNILFLIGGESKEYDWDGEELLNQITHIARHCDSPMVLTTSRRTAKDFVTDVSQACPNLRVESVEETGPNWVLDNLACAKEVWVTKDSVSMVYEALSSGVPVGILDMPRKGKKRMRDSRVTKGLKQLIKDERVTPFTRWAQTHTLLKGAHLDEASRAAEHIETHYPQLFV